MYDKYEVKPKFYYTIKCLDIDTFAYVNHQILFRIFDCECRENDRYTVDKGRTFVFIIKSENNYGKIHSVFNTETKVITIELINDIYDHFKYTILPLPKNKNEVLNIIKEFVDSDKLVFPILI